MMSKWKNTALVCLTACLSRTNAPSLWTTGTVRLNIETYYAGLDQATHPAVISFEKPWNGYRYWMAYTPYPWGNGEEETPSVAVSNDLYAWITPDGMVNPIADNEETGCRELKDPHILYRDDLDRIEIWYLGRISKQLGGDGTSLTLFRKYSSDGITWSDYEVMSTVEYLSPTVQWNGEKYQMWSIGFDTFGTTGMLVYQESEDGLDWTEPVKCSIGDRSEGLAIWHGAVTPTKDGYALVYVETENSTTIQYCESDDGKHFTENRTIVSMTDENWRNFYRPCLLVEDGEYTLFYGVTNGVNEWYLSMSRGTDIDSLTGITEEDTEKMVQLTSFVTNTASLRYKLRDIYHQMRNFIRFELLGLVPFFAAVLVLVHHRLNRKNSISMFICIASVLVCFGYTYMRIRPTATRSILALVLISLLEGICIHCISASLERFIHNQIEP